LKARIIRVFYRCNQNSNRDGQNSFMTRNRYFRVLAIGCFNILLTFPFELVNMIINIKALVKSRAPFYIGWNETHTNWSPTSKSYAEIRNIEASGLVGTYFPLCSYIVLSITTVVLFGLTPETCSKLDNWLQIVRKALGHLPASPAETQVSSAIVFASRVADPDAEKMRYGVLSLSSRWRVTFSQYTAQLHFICQ
jgi:hypothetical protein